MTDRREAPDAAARRRALAPGESFIVQAPAGSGKTELLIQRLLVLLAAVERPEEIVAITFTRKAAAEMRRRVFAALSLARTAERPVEAHRAFTWDLARAAVARDAQQGWDLAANASRLRIQTFDSLCGALTRQMPVLSRFGGQPATLEDAEPLHREAARETLAGLEGTGEAAPAIATLLAHVGHDHGAAEAMIVDILRRREHWLPFLLAIDREALESALGTVRRETVASAVRVLVEAGAMPEGDAGDTDPDHWRDFAKAHLTAKNEWRKASALGKGLDFADGPPLHALRALAAMPPAAYTDGQWTALEAIARVAREAVARLQVAFAARGEADFAEIAQGALAALGTDEAPTDLLLALDYRIRHVLVDEFQDTSRTQGELLRKLTAGWEPGDGRTLFVVGDPMQSIYRFREAEVGLFLRAQREGLGAGPPSNRCGWRRTSVPGPASSPG
jgi:ATP-dependent helicase/nuclease subunit A